MKFSARTERQVPLVSSAWDSATWNAAAAVVNSGGSALAVS